MNTNQRDYDENPIIIKDNKLLLTTFICCAVLIYEFIRFLDNPAQSQTRFNNLFIIYPIILYPILVQYFSSSIKNKYFVYFKNNVIEYCENYNITDEIILNSKTYIQKAIFFGDYNNLKNRSFIYKFLLEHKNFTKIFLMVVSFMLIYQSIIKGVYFHFLLAVIAIPFIMAILKSTYYLIFKHEFVFIIYDHIAIYNNDKSIVFTISSKKDYDLLRQYFLETINYDINKSKKVITADKK